jgi:four helix bundle protein
MAHRDLHVLEAAERAEDRVNALITRRSGPRLLHVRQMQDSAHAVGAIIMEGFGRGPGRDRARILRLARGEAEETVRHLASNYREKRIQPRDYWPTRDLLIVVVRMLTSLERQEQKRS